MPLDQTAHRVQGFNWHHGDTRDDSAAASASDLISEACIVLEWHHMASLQRQPPQRQLLPEGVVHFLQAQSQSAPTACRAQKRSASRSFSSARCERCATNAAMGFLVVQMATFHSDMMVLHCRRFGAHLLPHWAA